MNNQTTTPDGELFYSSLIADYVDAPRFVPRSWLAERVQSALGNAGCRFLLLIAEPGAGKTAFMAWLARQHPDWPRYFIRRDQRTPLGDVGAHSLLLQIGFQLAATYPQLFSKEQITVAVEQRIGILAETGQAVGAEVERIVASPFHQAVMQIQQQVDESKGNLIGIRVGEWITDPRLISVEDLQHMALLDPAVALLKTHPDEQIVVLVDALDELRYHSSQDSLLSWLATCPDLPSNLRIVLTSRPDEALLARFRGAQKPWLQELEITTDDPNPDVRRQLHADIRRYAQKLAGQSGVKATLGAVQATENFVDRAVEKAQGNIGYLDAVARAIDQALERGDQQLLIQLVDLSNLPSTLAGLYVSFLHQLKDVVSRKSIEAEDPETGDIRYLSAWPAVYQRILGVLTIAREPLTLSQIQRFGGIAVGKEYLVEAKEYLRQFLDQEGDSYRLYHATLVELLTAKSTWQNAETQDIYQDAVRRHHRIIASFRQGTEFWEEVDWSQVDQDHYGLRHLAFHLAASGQTDELYQLVTAGVTTNKWAEAHFRLSGSYTRYLRDVDLAWSEAEKSGREYVGSQIACALLESSIHSLAGGIEAELLAELLEAHVWSPDQALSYVQQVPNDRGALPGVGGQQARALAAVAPYLTEPLLHSALAMARVVEKGIKRGLALTWLIPYLPESERPAVIAEARTEIEAIDGRRERTEAFLELVPYLPKSERSTVIVDALAEARTIDLKDEIWQKGPNALPLTIVPALVPYLPEPERSTMIAEALAVARSVSVGRNRNEQGLALAQLVPHLPEPERPAVIAEALADARSFDPKNEQESYKEWRTGYLLKTLLTLVPHLPEPERPAVIAEASAVARELDPRVTTFGKWLLPQYLSQAERETMLQNGLRDAWSIQDERAQVEALVELASLLPEVKRRDVLDKASVIAQRIGDDFNRSMALDRLAEVSTQTTAPVDVRGPFPPPESISAEALAAVRNEPNWQKAVDIAKLGPYLQEPLVSEALQIAWSIDESNLRAHALAGLAAHLPEEVLEDVLADASAIEDNFIYGGKLREWALMYMVPSLTRLPLPKLYELWCRTLRTHSRLTRGDLLADVSALGPVIKVLGGERTLLETANAIMRVSRWFP